MQLKNDEDMCGTAARIPYNEHYTRVNTTFTRGLNKKYLKRNIFMIVLKRHMFKTPESNRKRENL